MIFFGNGFSNIVIKSLNVYFKTESQNRFQIGNLKDNNVVVQNQRHAWQDTKVIKV